MKAQRSVQGDVQGLAAAMLRGARTINDIRALTPLPPDAERMIDGAVVRAGRSRLVLVDELINRGLRKPLPNWMAVPTIWTATAGTSGHAQRTMVPSARGERHMPDLGGFTTPVYCTWDDTGFDVRTLLAAERGNYSIDDATVEECTRNVNVAIEDQGWNGLGFNVKGATAPGILTAPSVSTLQFVGGAAGRAWDDATKTGEHILTDAKAMIEELQSRSYYGPYVLFVTGSYGLKLIDDYKSATSGTILERLQQVAVDGNQTMTIRVADQLPANHVAMVQMTSDVIDLIDGQVPAALPPWTDGPGFNTSLMVLACQIVRVKNRYDGTTGIVVGNTVG